MILTMVWPWPWCNLALIYDLDLRQVKPSQTDAQVDKFIFSMRWTWPWSNDIDTQTWPRYCQDVPSHQKWSFYANWFKSYSLNRHTHTHRHYENITSTAYAGAKEVFFTYLSGSGHQWIPDHNHSSKRSMSQDNGHHHMDCLRNYLENLYQITFFVIRNSCHTLRVLDLRTINVKYCRISAAIKKSNIGSCKQKYPVVVTDENILIFLVFRMKDLYLVVT